MDCDPSLKPHSVHAPCVYHLSWIIKPFLRIFLKKSDEIHLISKSFCIFASCFLETQDMICSIASQSPPRDKSKYLLLELPLMGADFSRI